MAQNVKLLEEINNLIKEKHLLEKNILIMENIEGSGNNNNDHVNNGQISEADKELKNQEIVMESLHN